MLRNSANPTMLNAGYKVNVIPGTAEAHVDGRFLPGQREEFLETIDRLLGPKVSREFVSFEEAVSSPPTACSTSSPPPCSPRTPPAGPCRT